MFKDVPVRYSTDYHGQQLTLETGSLARQATASVLATMGKTTVIAAVVVGRETTMPYFPLQVIYEEKLYASGKIKGSRFIKREGRPSDTAILAGRMIDRSLRSLFNENIRNDIQVIITVLSLDEVNSPDTLGVLAASAALTMCGITQFTGPVSSVRIGSAKEDLRLAMTDKLVEFIPQTTDISQIEELLNDFAGIVDIKKEVEKEYFAKVFYALKDKDLEWAKKFKTDYSNTKRLSEKEIESKFNMEPVYVANPSYKQRKDSDIDIVVSGDGTSIVMLEAGANIVDEEKISQALDTANEELAILTEFQKQFLQRAKVAGLDTVSDVKIVGDNQNTLNYWNNYYEEMEQNLYLPGTKDEQSKNRNEYKAKHIKLWEQIIKASKEFDNINELKSFLLANPDIIDIEGAELVEMIEIALQKAETIKDLKTIQSDINYAYDEVLKNIIQQNILDTGRRIDGRDLTTTRDISCQIDVLDMPHGSSLFDRGETQVLNVLTLGTKSDAQILDDMEDFEDRTKRYIHHYNFPAYSVGETGRYMGPKRREIGHGALAEKAIEPVLPSEDEFPYTMRLVSECMGSNGSTSMASTCSSCLSLMAGGVPIKDIVAGVAMGLVLDKSTNKFKVITDIQGIEDHYGDMDFKVTGTKDGITAIQLDNKVAGMTVDVLKQALVQSKEARMHILNIMRETIATPKAELRENAPRVITTKIAVDKIGDVIGPGGKTIKEIIANTGAEIDIEEDGRVFVYAKSSAKAEMALEIIKKLVKEYEKGEEVSVKVFRIEAYGAFVKIDGGDKEGLIHISNMADKRVEKVEDVLKMGQTLNAKISEINDKGQIGLTLK